MKYQIDKIVPARDDDGTIVHWVAWVADVMCVGDTPGEAAACAQGYLTVAHGQNAKAAEPKPPEGYAFSDKPGLIDQRGYALAWCTDYGFTYGSPDKRVFLPTQHWLVPAAPKKESFSFCFGSYDMNEAAYVGVDVKGQADGTALVTSKKETWEEALARLEEYDWSYDKRAAFMRGAGFDL